MAANPESFGPLIGVAIAAKVWSDRGKLTTALAELAAADPSCHVVTDEETGQTILSGSSETHLDASLQRLQRIFGADIDIGAPQVAYRETLMKRVETDYTYKTHAGGVRQFARVKLVCEPTRAGPVFESKMAGDAIPAAILASVEKGINAVMSAGILAGFPLIYVKASLIDGACHDVDSSALAFEIAARAAFREALRAAGCVLLEPIMRVEITAPENDLGFLKGDVVARRGQVEYQTMRGGTLVIHAMVPLANLFGYANQLRAGTQGRGIFKMQFAHYRQVEDRGGSNPPPAVAAALRA